MLPWFSGFGSGSFLASVETSALGAGQVVDGLRFGAVDDCEDDGGGGFDGAGEAEGFGGGQGLDIGCVPRRPVLPVHLLCQTPLLGCIGPVAGDVKLQGYGVVHHPVNRRGGGHGIGEDVLPLRGDQGCGTWGPRPG